MSAPTRVSPASFLKLSGEVASFYGFRPLKEVERGSSAPRRAHNFTSCAQACAAGTASPSSLTPDPVLAYYASYSPAHLPTYGEDISARDVGEFGLEIAGTQESVGEVLLLKTIATILTEWGAAPARIRVNALGDRDSKMRFTRELSAYMRRHSESLDEVCRAKLGEDPLGAYACALGACKEVLLGGPRTMSFLSEKSRAHFKEVLEHLDGLGVPYELDDMLIGDEREPGLAFAIDLADEDATVLGSMGGRYDEHVRKLTGKKEGSAVHASIFFRKSVLAPASFVLGAPTARPRIYFVQLGLRAKLQSLQVSDLLRRAHIPVLQSFDSSKLAPQLQAAKTAGVSHLIIMGQREALDGTVIVRAADNSSQTILQLSSLPRFLKTLH